MALQILFWVIAAVCLLAALMVVTSRNLVHAALYLVLTLSCVAALFVLLESGFFAVIQVLVYIGAIAILMIFAVMMTRDITGEDGEALNENWGWAAVIAVIAGAGLIVTVGSWPGIGEEMVALPYSGTELMAQFGFSLWQDSSYLIPTLVASILLLAAMIGAIKVAWPKK